MDTCFYYFDQRLRERNACVLHPYANFRTIVHDYAISDGKIWVALNSEHIPVGIIFTVPAGGSSFVAKELVADSEEVKEALLRTALNHYHASSGIYRTVVPHASPDGGQTIPFGMARIIDANKMLSMWAAVNPERRLIIHLSDPLLTNNNGSYIIENGKCFKTTNNEHIHAFEVLTMDIGQLAHFLIYPEHPFMSLMFD